MIKGDLYQIYWEFIGKKNINFQKTKHNLNSTFHRELKEYVFVWISRKKILFDTSFWRVVDDKLYWEFLGKTNYEFSKNYNCNATAM